MAHKTLIGGTAYEIAGGKTLVNGTVYTIESGKTLINGTVYTIDLKQGFTLTSTYHNFSNMSSGATWGLGVVVKDPSGNVTDHVLLYASGLSTAQQAYFNHVTYTKKVAVTKGSDGTATLSVPEGGSLVFEIYGTAAGGTYYPNIYVNNELIFSHMVKDDEEEQTPDNVVSPVTADAVITGPAEDGETGNFYLTMEGYVHAAT